MVKRSVTIQVDNLTGCQYLLKYRVSGVKDSGWISWILKCGGKYRVTVFGTSSFANNTAPVPLRFEMELIMNRTTAVDCESDKKLVGEIGSGARMFVITVTVSVSAPKFFWENLRFRPRKKILQLLIFGFGPL